MTKWVIYLTVNDLNLPFYIGKAKKKRLRITTSSSKERYIGSSPHLQNDRRKYGIEHFRTIILLEFDDEQKCYDVEAKIVSQEFLDSFGDMFYNKQIGGGVAGVGSKNSNELLPHETYVKRVSEKSNNAVKVNGVYTGYYKKIEHECLTCGYKWKIAPGSFKGCRYCKNNTTPLHKQLKKKNILVLEKYVEKSKLKCLTCNHIWISYSSFVNKSGCPECNKINSKYAIICKEIKTGKIFLFRNPKKCIEKLNLPENLRIREHLNQNYYGYIFVRAKDFDGVWPTNITQYKKSKLVYDPPSINCLNCNKEIKKRGNKKFCSPQCKKKYDKNIKRKNQHFY